MDTTPTPVTPIPIRGQDNQPLILYLLCHPTLTDFELPMLISKGYGVFLVKKNSFEHVPASLGERDHEQYDNFLFMDPHEIRALNAVNWYKNDRLDPKVIDLLNSRFKWIFITLLTSGSLLKQLIDEFKGTICYRFFGREGTHSYYQLISDYVSPKVKYIFSYPDVYLYEKSLSTIYNADNSYVIPLGLPNKFVVEHLNTYHPIHKRVCFVCSKIGHNPYYTNIYQQFKTQFKNFPYIIVGRDNNTKICEMTPNKVIKNNLSNKEFYKEFKESTVFYYHSQEPRHLHYPPLEAIIIGIPIIFHSQSMLSSYLSQSLGRCSSMAEVDTKIKQILNGDQCLVRQIITEQNKAINSLTQVHNKQIFDKILDGS